MLTRRFLRVKAFKILFGYAYSDNDSLTHAEKELNTSLKRTYDLYHFLFSTILAVADYAEERIEIGLRKFKPTTAEVSPNRKFINNELIIILRKNESLRKYCQQHVLNWRDYPEMVRFIYQNMTERAYYKTYMNSSDGSFAEDCRLVEEFFRNEFEDVPEIESLLEDINTAWADDLGFVLSSIIRTLGSFHPGLNEDAALMPMYNSKEDEEFVYELLRRSLMHFKEYANLAHKFIQNWESDRIAYVDLALIIMGVAEAITFPVIPVNVTINEYVEIAKYYSTRNSHFFVNGVLDRLIQHLISEGTVKKTGRGLIEASTIKNDILKQK